MNWRTSGLRRAALSALYFSGAGALMAPLARGAGVIFALQRVGPPARPGFAPNRCRSVTPEFLDSVVGLVRERGFDVLSLEEVHYRLAEGDLDTPFACFTLDGGYRDAIQHAVPVLRRHGAPYAVYVATDCADGRGDLWWLVLEATVRAARVIEIKMDGVVRRLACGTVSEKTASYRLLHDWLGRIAEDEARLTVAELAREHGIDAATLCRGMVVDWDEVRALTRDPLATIGAHTRRHYALARLPVAAARLEIEESIQRIEAETGRPCRHLSYPYGDARSACRREFDLVRELGLRTAVTMRSGLVRPQHSRTLTALPRIALDGEMQRLRYVKAMLSGVAQARAGGVRQGEPEPATVA